MRAKTCILLAFLALLPVRAVAVVAEGQPAPQVKMKLLKDGGVADFPGWQAYKGKVVVVELWGTWCVPCVAAIPHMNELRRAFEGKPIEFLAVTDESAAAVRKFQKRHPMAGTVGVEGGAAVRALGTGRFPQTVIISKTGAVLRYTMPEELSVKNLSKLLETGSAEGIKRVLVETSAKKKAEARSLFELRVDSAACDGGGRAGHSPGDAQYSGDLGFMLAQAYEFSASNIEISSGLPKQCFSFRLRYPRELEYFIKPLLKEAIAFAYGAEARRTVKEKPVCVLRYDKDAPHAGLVPARKSGRMAGRDGEYSAEGAGIGDLVGLFEWACGTPVIDETGLTGIYDVSLKWTPRDKDSLKAAITERLGITLEPSVRSVEVLEAYPSPDR